MDKWLTRKIGIALFLIVLFFFSSISFAEKVGKLTYTGVPEALDGKTEEVPSHAVLMSERVFVGQPEFGIKDTSVPPSIFFVIDHSGSMYGVKYNATDRWGNRLKVTKKLVDAIYEKYPDAEVGFTVFAKHLYFDTTDDNSIITNVTGNDGTYYEGGYIPLLKLNKKYNSDALGEKTGYEIIDHYLKTDTSTSEEANEVNGKYLNFLYRPSYSELAVSNTNITAGFDAVKDAFNPNNTSSLKKNQYVIFFSDGDAQAPSNNDVKNEFQKGENVPTTFTVYFTSNSGVPSSIETMTNNIKENDYSTNNKLSKYWPYDNSQGEEKLTDFLFDSVFSVITTSTESKPNNITINGEEPDGLDSSSGEYVYIFSKTFPFKQEENDFKYVIKYEYAIPDPNDTTKTIEKDSTIETNFTIKLTEGATLDNDIFTLDCWDRSIKFYDQNGTQLSSLYEAVENLEVRFEVKKEDIFYEYDKDSVALDVVSVDSSFDGSGNLTDVKILDKESLDLKRISNTDSTQVFSAKIPIGLDAYKQNNGKLETDFVDDFYFTFRNNNKIKLPLDTLVTHIHYGVSGVIEMEEAFYYDTRFVNGDKGADGLVDSIIITLKNDSLDLDEDDLELFLKNLTLPSYRDFEILDSSITNNSISLRVNEKAKRNNTEIHDDDVIKMGQITLDSGYVSSKSIVPKDKMAPVIISARAIQYEAKNDSTADSLIVKFSEPVSDINDNEPFLFLETETGLEYNSVELTLINNDNDKKEVTFEINQVNRENNVINNGDSIWINTNGNSVSDLADDKNTQEESDNIKRPILAHYVAKPFDITVKVTGPIDFIDPDENSAIDSKIIEKLDPDNLEQLVQTDDDEFHGMLIIGETIGEGEEDGGDPQDIELRGKFAIYDCVGSSVWKASKMSFDDETKTLYYVWNGKNTQGRIVGGGTYISIMHIESVSTISGEVTEERTIKKFLTVKN